MKYLIILLFVSILILSGCSKSVELNNIKSCQEGCLDKNMSFNEVSYFNERNESIKVVKCSCNFYIEVVDG